jgi:hypothetical protein
VPLPEPTNRERRRVGERGATMVETAIVFPLFILLVFGIIEFSFAYAQNNELRHVAREAAREVSVDAAASASLICDGFALIEAPDVTYSFTGISDSDPDAPGGMATVSAAAQVRTLTGFFDSLLASTQLTTTHSFFVEQTVLDAGPGWLTGSTPCA